MFSQFFFVFQKYITILFYYFWKGPEREWNFGFGFGASWMCVILMFMSEVLLICDRESEEIFYKERDAEEGEEEEKEDDWISGLYTGS